MSISSIQGTAAPQYTVSNRKLVNGTDNAVVNGNRNTGPDTVSFSEEALRKAGLATSGSTDTQEAEILTGNGQTKETGRAATAKSLGSIGKKSLFAMMLESLFLAELEESSSAESTPADTSTEQASEVQTPRSKNTKAASANPMQDGEKVAQLKKVINNFMQGKADLSDLPKAMATGTSGATGESTGVTGKNSGNTAGSKITGMENTIGS